MEAPLLMPFPSVAITSLSENLSETSTHAETLPNNWTGVMEECKSDSPSGIRCSSQLVRRKSEQTEIQKCGRIFAGSSPGQQDECGEKSTNFLPPAPTPPLLPGLLSPFLPLHSSHLSLSLSQLRKSRPRGKWWYKSVVITVLLHFRSHMFNIQAIVDLMV